MVKPGFSLLRGWDLRERDASLSALVAIDYDYASQLRSESAAVEDIHFHPIESRSLRLTLIRNW